MSSEYYLIKWRNTIITLENLIKLDCEYQEIKAHDKQWCDAVQRLSRILGSYISSYNDAVDCLHQNMQIQKTVYIANIVNAIVARILELKEQLRKLEGTCYQFLSKGLIDRKLTSYDTEFRSIPSQYKRTENIGKAVIEALEKVKYKNEEIIEEEEEEKIEEILEKANWWEDDEGIQEGEHHGINITQIYEVKQIISEESLERQNKIALIQAQEKTRQITTIVMQQKQRRVLWEKELKGILKPAASRDLRERSAYFIQRVMRCFFKIKRDRIKECKRDELLHIRLCNKPNLDYKVRDEEITQRRIDFYQMYEKQWEIDCEEYIEDYKKRKGDEIAEDFRDYIRDWFQKWYVEAKFFYDIPREKQGGSILILQEEVPLPSEWLDQYKAYLEDKKANKNKTALQLKYEKLAQKEEAMLLRREELQKKKLEAQLLKKMMKNPTLHPGYNYPMSKKIENLRESIQKYNKDWSELDFEQRVDVKENYINDLNKEHLCMIAKLDIFKDTEPLMREELKVLKKALAEEYKSNEQVMPKKIEEKVSRTRKKRKIISNKEEHIQDKLIAMLNLRVFQELAENGILKECPATRFADFLGDPNYAGDELRCDLRSPLPFGAETRSIWWERCREVMHGFRRILLLGPRGSGKTTLAHIMATETNAVFYELDPSQMAVENQTTGYLNKLITSLVICAEGTQPSIIFIKNVHMLFYSKVPPEDSYIKFDLIKRYFIRKLFKKIHKHCNITIIGSCINPWMTRSKQLLKKFNSVLLLPDTSYSAVQLILRNWVINNRIVPSDLDTQSLAYFLKGYPFALILKALEDFLTADRIVKIAAYGLSAIELYNYILENYELDFDYDKYVSWYTNNTHWGKTEIKRLEERIEFKSLVDQFNEKMKKKKPH